MIARVKKITLRTISDNRGSLVAIERGNGIPFEPKRVYYIFNTEKNTTRGLHAHIKLSQLLIATSGTVTIKCEYRNLQQEFILDKPTEGLLIEGLVWREMENFSDDAVLMVLASEIYDEDDYIRDYNEFLYLSNNLHN